jgi:hypothetical protein
VVWVDGHLFVEYQAQAADCHETGALAGVVEQRGTKDMCGNQYVRFHLNFLLASATLFVLPRSFLVPKNQVSAIGFGQGVKHPNEMCATWTPEGRV